MLTANSFAQDNVFVDVFNAENAKQGESVTIRAEIDFKNVLPAGTSSIQLRLSYMTNRLNFERVTGGTAVGGCVSPTVTQDTIDETSGNYGFITISCNDIQQSDDNATFFLQFRVLGGQEDSALIEPRSLVLNNDSLEQLDRSEGVITFDQSEPPVFPTYPEDLGEIAPNPFNVEAKVFYSIQESTNVRFKIFDLLGKEVLDDNIGVRGRGVYSYTISPLESKPWINYERSSELYTLIMVTDNGVYQKTLLYLK